jgi:nucleoside-diphosphate-sugar epimerase
MSSAPYSPDKRELAGARVFVTGGTGFLGRNLVRDLRARGADVHGLAWTSDCERILESDGAKPVRGSFGQPASLIAGLRGSELVVHAAGYMRVWGDLAAFRTVNVEGTRNVLDACRHAGVRRVVHVSAAAVVMGDKPAVGVDEVAPRQYPNYSAYIRTKSEAEDVVLAANGDKLQTVIIRPPGIWGAGDPYFLPKISSAVVSGKFKWIDNGEYPFSTCHVSNVCEGIGLALTQGRPGEAYFVTDDTDVTFRELLTGLLGARGVKAPTGSVPFDRAWRMAQAFETIWKVFPLSSEPPLTRSLLKLTGQAFKVSDAKARAELGYRGRTSRRAGLLEMSGPVGPQPI